MKKNELVEKVAEGASLTKADAERAINALVDAVSGALVEGDKVALKGLGTFEVRKEKRELVSILELVKLSKSQQVKFLLLKQVLHLRMQ